MEKGDCATRLKAVNGLALLKRTEGLVKIFAFVESLEEIDEDAKAELVDAVVSILGHRQLPMMVKSELAKLNKSFCIIVEALGILRSEDAVPLLEGLMRTAGKQEMRHVVSAIGAIGSPAPANAPS